MCVRVLKSGQGVENILLVLLLRYFWDLVCFFSCCLSSGWITALPARNCLTSTTGSGEGVQAWVVASRTYSISDFAGQS